MCVVVVVSGENDGECAPHTGVGESRQHTRGVGTGGEPSPFAYTAALEPRLYYTSCGE